MAFTPLNYRLSEDGLRQLIDRLPTPLVIADAEYRDVVAGAGKQVITSDEFIDAARTAEPAPEFPDPDDVAVVLFTSGTTSRPKAVELTHNNLTSYVTGTVEFDSADPSDAALICVPPYHIAGVGAALSNLYAGRKMVYLRQFDPNESVRLVRDEGVTTATVAPTMLDRIVSVLEAERSSCPSCGTWLMVVRRSLFRWCARRLACCPTSASQRLRTHRDQLDDRGAHPDDHRTALASSDDAVARRLGSVGQPVPSIEVQIRGEDGTVSTLARAVSCSCAASRSGTLYRYRFGPRRRRMVPHQRRCDA